MGVLAEETQISPPVVVLLGLVVTTGTLGNALGKVTVTLTELTLVVVSTEADPDNFSPLTSTPPSLLPKVKYGTSDPGNVLMLSRLIDTGEDPENVAVDITPKLAPECAGAS